MRISNVYIVIVVSSNANIACGFKFVVGVVALFKLYFGGAFYEDTIRQSFVLIYELLDARKHLKDKPVRNATLQVKGAVGWRREGLAYKKNEMFLDIVESVNLLISSKGNVLRCDVTGKV